MKSDVEDIAFPETIRPRNETSKKKKLIAFIKKQKDKQLEQKGYKKKKKMVGYSEGEWTLRQLKLYYRYLFSHKNQFTDPQLRKRNKVFIKLADFIGSRTPDQCRSHHQKATNKFRDFETLLKNYETKIFNLSKLYVDVNQTQIREKERSEGKNIGDKVHSNQMMGGSVEAQRGKVMTEIHAKIEENYQKQDEKLRLSQEKVEKATGAVETRDFYRFWMKGQGRGIEIEIEENAMQIFN